MRRFTVVTLTFLFLLTAADMTAGQTGSELFQQAVVKERANGDIRGAIEIYQRIVREFTDDRGLVARALVQMGGCYEKLGISEAHSAYQRVVDEYADQTEQVAEARGRLAVLARLANESGEGPSIATRRVWTGREANEASSFAPTPDGRLVLYVDLQGSNNLMLRDLTTASSRYLTRDAVWDDQEQYAYARGPVASPDGALAAFGWVREGETALRIVGIDGSGLRILSREEGCGISPFAWTSDSRHVVAWRRCRGQQSGEQVVFVAVSDGSSRLVKEFDEGIRPGREALSPDDRYVAYDVAVQRDGGKYDIWLATTDGSDDVPLVEHPANDRLLGWVPGTDDLLFSSDRNGTWDVWALRVALGRGSEPPRLVRRGLGNVDPLGFGRSGDLFYNVFTRWFATSVAPVDAVTGEVGEESATPILGSNYAPIWSPDGENLAFSNEQLRPRGPGRYNIAPLHVRNLATGEEREFLGHMRIARPNCWSPDGRSILVSAWDETDDHEPYYGALYAIDAEGGEVTPILYPPTPTAPGGIGAVWSRDGRAIYYARIEAGTNEGRLVRLEIESGREVELLKEPGLAARSLAVSPSGGHLAFGVRDSLGESASYGRIMVLDLASTEMQQLAAFGDSGWVGSVQWSADGGSILYALTRQYEQTDMWKVTIGGGEPEKLGSFGEGKYEASFRLSPDGRRIVYTTYAQESEVWVMENLKEVLQRRD